MALFLLDGPSASGKSRLKDDLLFACPDLSFCRRVTTRPARADGSDQDYDFVTPEQFKELETSGELAAWRHFDFQMSYGLARAPVELAERKGQSVLALIDLGTIAQARQCWPHAVGILLLSPLEQLKERLQQRGCHSPAQIEERLRNAQTIWNCRSDYDHWIHNDGAWSDTLQQMLEILKKYRGPTK